MIAANYPAKDISTAKSISSENHFRFSFSSFQKAIKSNSEVRKQIEDIVDLGLFDYMLRRNSSFIQSVRKKAEAETIELLMRFTNDAYDYQKLKKTIHRNRLIRTLANMDRKAQLELLNKFKNSMVGAK